MSVPLDNSTALRNDFYHGWMGAPNTRATTDIIWTCLATIILCVYTAVHLNLPDPEESTRWQALRRTKWVVLAIFAPELVLQAAYKQFDDARCLQRRLKQYAASQLENKDASALVNIDADAADAQSGLRHDLEAGLGKPRPMITNREVDEVPAPEDITLTYAFYAVMGGFRLRITQGDRAGQTFTMTPAAIDEFAQAGFFWNISTKSIQDKSKADNLAKTLTVVQVLWMIIQCAARKVQNLPLTLFEVHTFIHAVCAAVMFALWFYKPLDVRDATYRKETPDVSDLVRSLVKRPDVSKLASRLSMRRINYGRDHMAPMSLWSRIHVLRAHDLGFDPIFIGDECNGFIADFMMLIMFVVLQPIYGCLHMIAWSSHFPTIIEQWLWRASCISIASVIFIVISYVLVRQTIVDNFIQPNRKISTRLKNIIDGLDNCLSMICFCVLFVVWAGSRIYIVVESLISLRSVPIGVYAAVQWSSYFPHI